MTPTLVFDIETIPDIAGLRHLYDVGMETSDQEVAEMASLLRRQQTGGSDFLAHYLQRVVTISCVLREADRLHVFSLAEPEADEGQIIQRFFDGIEKYTPQLVSWNGGGFDLPVLHYRAMRHGVAAGRYWDWGDDDRDFRYNNYLNRYHTRHIDLMDVLAMYSGRANAPLDNFARLLGFPGKLGMDGGEVWGAWQRGEIDAIRDYCETDAVNTWLVYLRFQKMRGILDDARHDAEIALVRRSLTDLGAPHWQEFLAAWPA
ncbi:MAG TPA: 3'-5' exonuclease [Thiobacillaceae bacterium]|nr:3'-5' exonuclease [Thiobacillaceae bacterium]HNU64690.1 3'-5' exonuclease [Thiobacillaceae bacterium]